MRQNRVHLMPPMSNFYARICVKATPSSNKSYSATAWEIFIQLQAKQNFVFIRHISTKNQ